MSEENVSLPVAQALASALAKIEAYVPTEYVDNSEPDIDAEHLNHAEQGIMRVTNLLNAAVDVIQGQESRISDAETKIGNAETKIGTDALTGGMTDLSSGINSLYSNFIELNGAKLKCRKYTKTFANNTATTEFDVEGAKQIIAVVPDGYSYGLFAGINDTRHLYLRAVNITSSPITFASNQTITFTVYYV